MRTYESYLQELLLLRLKLKHKSRFIDFIAQNVISERIIRLEDISNERY